MERRQFILQSATLVGANTIGRHADPIAATSASTADTFVQPPAVVPVSEAERLARIEKARRIMVENGIDAMLPGSAVARPTARS